MNIYIHIEFYNHWWHPAFTPILHLDLNYKIILSILKKKTYITNGIHGEALYRLKLIVWYITIEFEGGGGGGGGYYNIDNIEYPSEKYLILRSQEMSFIRP